MHIARSIELLEEALRLEPEAEVRATACRAATLPADRRTQILFTAGLLPATRPWSRWLLILLTLAVTPANVHMWLNPHLFPDLSEIALTLRLVVQVLLIALIWWSTRIVQKRRTRYPKSRGIIGQG